jgi:predicted dehydrogenase
VRWRYDPKLAGISAQFADCGIHALQMASYVSGQDARELSADFVSCLKSRTLEDDALVNFRMDGGAVLRLWTSSIAVGSMHGLNIRVFGEKGGLRWAQEWPNQLFWTPLNGRTEILERGGPNLSPEADRASRVTIGHAEGMPLAFANLYSDIAEVLNARREGRAPDPLATHFPTAIDGLRSIAAISAAVDSARAGGAWVDARPPSLRGS